MATVAGISGRPLRPTVVYSLWSSTTVRSPAGGRSDRYFMGPTSTRTPSQ
jgi:hypothetical protein